MYSPAYQGEPARRRRKGLLKKLTGKDPLQELTLRKRETRSSLENLFRGKKSY